MKFLPPKLTLGSSSSSSSSSHSYSSSTPPMPPEKRASTSMSSPFYPTRHPSHPYLPFRPSSANALLYPHLHPLPLPLPPPAPRLFPPHLSSRPRRPSRLVRRPPSSKPSNHPHRIITAIPSRSSARFVAGGACHRPTNSAVVVLQSRNKRATRCSNMHKLLPKFTGGTMHPALPACNKPLCVQAWARVRSSSAWVCISWPKATRCEISLDNRGARREIHTVHSQGCSVGHRPLLRRQRRIHPRRQDAHGRAIPQPPRVIPALAA